MILITLRAPTLSSGTIILMSIAPVTLTRAGQLRALARNVALDSSPVAMPGLCCTPIAVRRTEYSV